jgi:hypothetical protein
MLVKLIKLFTVPLSLWYFHSKETQRKDYVKKAIHLTDSTEELPLLPFNLSQEEINKLVVQDPRLLPKVEEKYLNNSLVDSIFKLEGEISESDKSLAIVGKLLQCMNYGTPDFRELLKERSSKEILRRPRMAYFLDVNGYEVEKETSKALCSRNREMLDKYDCVFCEKYDELIYASE